MMISEKHQLFKQHFASSQEVVLAASQLFHKCGLDNVNHDFLIAALNDWNPETRKRGQRFQGLDFMGLKRKSLTARGDFKRGEN